MTSFNKYLLHRIKATWVLTAVLCLFAIIITLTTIKVYRYTYYDVVYDDVTGEPTKEEVLREGARINNHEVIFVILAGLCAVIPVLELGGLKNKRNADTMYSLPIDRRKMGAAHFANGFLQILAVYLCTAISATLMIVPVGAGGFLHLQYLPPLILLPIPAALLLYAYFSYLFNEANSTIDGCLFIASGVLMPFILGVVLSDFTIYRNGEYIRTIFNKMDGWQMLPYFPIIKIVDVFGDGLRHKNISFSYDDFDITMIIVWSAVCILAAVGFYLSFSRKRVETIGNISSSWVGYKTIIPICMFCITCPIYNTGDWFVVIIGAIAAIIGYMLYRRSFKVKAVDLISIGSGVFVAFVLRLLEDILNTGGRP
jgi:hypothetical protein